MTRLVKDMTPAELEKRREYFREYYRQRQTESQIEKRKQYRRDYYRQHRADILAYQKEWRERKLKRAN